MMYVLVFLDYYMTVTYTSQLDMCKINWELCLTIFCLFTLFYIPSAYLFENYISTVSNI